MEPTQHLPHEDDKDLNAHQPNTQVASNAENTASSEPSVEETVLKNLEEHAGNSEDSEMEGVEPSVTQELEEIATANKTLEDIDKMEASAHVDEAESSEPEQPQLTKENKKTVSEEAADTTENEMEVMQEQPEVVAEKEEVLVTESSTAKEEIATTEEQEEEKEHKVIVAKDLQEWWEQYDFKGKHYTELSEEGNLFLKETALVTKRSIGRLDYNSAAQTILALLEKFEEVKARVEEFAKDWVQQEDKMKMFGRYQTTIHHLNKVSALGDFDFLFTKLLPFKEELDASTTANLAKKEVLLQEVEALKDSTNWKESTLRIKEISEEWKKAGTLDSTVEEPLWKRLEAAKNHFFEEKRKAYLEQEQEMLQNLDLKMDIVARAEVLAGSTAWRKTTDAFKALMEEWKATGRTMPDKNEALWQRFIAAKNAFFDKKKENFKTIQAEQLENLEKKEALILQAEEWKESEDWNATSKNYAELMEQWKKIGRVPLENAEEIWAKLSAAKDYFFDRKKMFFETRKVDLNDNHAQKTALIQRAEDLKNSTLWRETTEELNELMEEWKKIGPVPREQTKTLWNEFLSARKFFFDRKDADRDKRKKRMNLHKEIQDKYQLQAAIRMEDEYAEEKEKLKDFKEAINNITPGPKSEELKTHLGNLIVETEENIKKLEQNLAARKPSSKGKGEKQEMKPKPEAAPTAAVEENFPEAASPLPEPPAKNDEENFPLDETAVEKISNETPGDPSQATEENKEA